MITLKNTIKFYITTVNTLDSIRFALIILYLLSILAFMIKIGIYLNLHTNYLENFDWMNSSVSSNTPEHTNTQGGDPSNNNGQDNNNNIMPYDTEEDRRRLKECMRQKLINHHISCANTNPYDTRLDDKFTPQEHEYIAEQVVKSQRPIYIGKIEGQYPERRYLGKISLHFISKVFNN